MLDRLDLPVKLRELGQPPVTFELRFGRAGVVALTADHQQLAVAMANRPQRPHRRSRGDQHRLGDRSGDGSRHAVGAAREGAGEERAAVEERNQRRDDGVVGDDGTMLGLDTDRRPSLTPVARVSSKIVPPAASNRSASPWM